MDNDNESPFYEGHKIYIGLIAIPDSPSSTRVMTTAYLYKTKEAPISGRAFLTRWKVLYSATRTEELRNTISKQEIDKFRRNTNRKISQAVPIIPKTGFAIISGADTSLDIKERRDAREYFSKKLSAFSDDNIRTVTGNLTRGLVQGSSTEIAVEIANNKSPSSSVQSIIYNVFKDLIEEGNGVLAILKEIVDSGDEFEVDSLVEQLSLADSYIYKQKSKDAEENLDDEALDEESRERMMSRAAALITALGVLGDPPLDYDTIKFEAGEDQELHNAAVAGALAVLKQL